MRMAQLDPGIGPFLSAQASFETLTCCPLCAGERFTDFHRSVRRGVPLRFVTCRACGFIFQNPRPARPALDRYFNSTTFIADGGDDEKAFDEPLGYVNYFDFDRSYEKTAAYRLKRIAALQPAPKRLLEIGSATGSFLAAARAAGYEVRGLDISKTFADLATRRHGLDVDIGWIEDFPLPESHYDVVCMFGGISCWYDFVRGLRNVRRTLAPNGIFAFNYSDSHGPIARLWGARYPEINPGSMSLLHRQAVSAGLQKTGFEIMLSQTERQVASLDRIATYLKLRALKRVAAFLRIQNLLFPVLAVGTTFVIARKR